VNRVWIRLKDDSNAQGYGPDMETAMGLESALHSRAQREDPQRPRNEEVSLPQRAQHRKDVLQEHQRHRPYKPHVATWAAAETSAKSRSNLSKYHCESVRLMSDTFLHY
jgi:hypothetical protein